MFLQTKNGRAAVDFVTADPFKDPHAIVECMGQYVDIRLRPGDEFPVHPDF